MEEVGFFFGGVLLSYKGSHMGGGKKVQHQDIDTKGRRQKADSFI